MTSSGYLRFPHVHGDLITFVAEDDVWLTPAGGGRGWRLSADQALASRPRLSPDGTQVAWTGTRDDSAEVYVAAADGGAGRRLTYWGSDATRTCGWTPAGEVLAVTDAGEPFGTLTWAHTIGLAPGAEPVRDTRLPYGQVADLNLTSDGVALQYVIATSANGAQELDAYKGSTHNSNTLVFSVVLDPTAAHGTYDLTLAGNLDHPASGSQDDNLLLN